jgi:mono/diheme cytochrome c family protein
VCTTCHNIEQEDPNLRFSDPETRLPYVKAKGIPFLQGTTFKGIVNRESWYNDDYINKYGEEKISKAHNNLRESIQLCAVECSQGRKMKSWEIEAVLAYFWTLQYDFQDLKMTEDDINYIINEIDSEGNREDLITWIKRFYLQKSPAHFYDSPADKNIGYVGLEGNADRGQDLYELSCLHCHKDGGVSHYILDDNPLSFIDIKNKINKNSHYSLYQIIPYGTYAIPGHSPYMPHYPLERMSKQQVEDLRTYVESKIYNK